MVPVVCILGVLVILNTHLKTARDNHKSLAFTIRCMGLTMWPLVITSLCPNCPHVIPGTLWMLAMEIMNALVLMDPSSSKGLGIEKAGFLGVVFALTAMCGNRPDSIYAKLFIYSILGMFLTVFPSHDLSKDSVCSVVLESFQQVILHYCVAVFVIAVSLTRSRTECKA